jgi:hypothetical protein
VDRDLVHFFDRFDVFELALIVSILSLTIVDGMLTVELLSADCEEANPLMKLVLQRGHGTFFVVNTSRRLWVCLSSWSSTTTNCSALAFVLAMSCRFFFCSTSCLFLTNPSSSNFVA